jgi:hypothetical protein
LAGCGEKVPRLAPVGPNDVIVAFGDSLTYGTGAAEADSYPAVLARLINRSVVRAGVPGEMTAGGLTRLESVMDEYRPALVIVCLGGNDMLRRLDDGQIRSNLREIVRAIKARGISVVLVGVPKPALITSAPAFYEEVAREFGTLRGQGRHERALQARVQIRSHPSQRPGLPQDGGSHRRIAQESGRAMSTVTTVGREGGRGSANFPSPDLPTSRSPA